MRSIINTIAPLGFVLVLLAGCAPDEPETIALEDTTWQLLRIQSLNDYEWIPDDPGKYVLRFRSENRLEGTSDCNRVGGNWRQDENGLTLEEFFATRAMCPPGTLHNHFVSNLSNVNGYSLQDGNLRLETRIAGVYLEMEPLSGL